MSEITRAFPATWYTWETGEEFCMQIALLNYGFEYGIVLGARDNEPISCFLYCGSEDHDLKDINRPWFTNWAEEAQDLDATRRRYDGGYVDPEVQRLDLAGKALKTTVVLDAAQFARCQVPAGVKHVWLSVTTADGWKVEGHLNPESVRAAIARIVELGADNVAVTLQGELKLALRALKTCRISVEADDIAF